uniref:JmjC domain-containing protein n=1 Tax=Attheya septentrionalis TaxID=420275 RepID=A0A7S2XU57_9STRA|mmetsp:Transcript_29285/g.53584  ORF Transcript_29285/g.53584 Transcript_29285/m.53584 type:complete len:628 (+) Transcript_29285:68-1951(+)
MTRPCYLAPSRRFRTFCLYLAFGVSSSVELKSPTLTPSIVPQNWQDEAIYECEVLSNCGGLIFDNVGTPEERATHMLHVPIGVGFGLYPEIYVSSKPWLVHRGAVTVSTRDVASVIVRTATDITIEEARAWCQSDEECIGFSFPWKSEKSLLTVDEVVFINAIVDFDYGYNANSNTYPVEWITHILHDRSKLSNRISDNIDIREGKWQEGSTTPYRPCCSANSTMPTIQELQEADTMERISCNISRADFYEQYEMTRKMVILEGCTDEWKAKDRWSSIERLLDRFDNETTWEFFVDSKVYPESTWSSVKSYYDIHKKKNSIETSGGLRLFRRLDPDNITNTLKEDYDVPQPFQDPNLDLYEKLPKFKTKWFPRGFGGPLQWFIVGSYGTGTGPHVDPHSTDAWSTLLTGHKWWVIYPKLPGSVSEIETKCSEACSDENSEFHVSSKANSWYVSVAKHASKFYYNNDAKAQLILQRAGETIYLPHGTIHAVANMDETIAVTEKWASRGNLEEIWREILTSGEPGDWQALYYHALNKEERKRIRNILWPITEESVKDIILSHVIYGGKGTDPSTFRYETEEEVDDEEDLDDEEDWDGEEDWDDEEDLDDDDEELMSYDTYLLKYEDVHS